MQTNYKLLFFTLIFAFGVFFSNGQSTFFNAESGAEWISMDLHIHTVFSDG